MIKYMTAKEQELFWRRHSISHKKILDDFNELPEDDKLRIRRKMNANHDAMCKAKVLRASGCYV